MLRMRRIQAFEELGEEQSWKKEYHTRRKQTDSLALGLEHDERAGEWNVCILIRAHWEAIGGCEWQGVTTSGTHFEGSLWVVRGEHNVREINRNIKKVSNADGRWWWIGAGWSKEWEVGTFGIRLGVRLNRNYRLAVGGERKRRIKDDAQIRGLEQ